MNFNLSCLPFSPALFSAYRQSTLRNQLSSAVTYIGTLDKRDDIQQAIMELTKTEFVRLHMKDMKYLVRSFQPSPLAMWIIFILATLAEIGLTYWTVTNDITDDDPDWADKFGNGY